MFKLYFVFLTPSAYSIVWLFFYTFSGEELWDGIVSSYDIPISSLAFTHLFPFGLILVFIVIIFAITVFPIGIKDHLKEFLLHSPLFLSPLAITGHWAMMAGSGFLGFGDYGTFLRWLVKYPNFGPVNYEVFLGILCVLGSSFIPVMFAVCNLMSIKRTRILSSMLIADLLLYAAVLIKLDLDSLYACQLSIYLPVVIGAPVFRIVPIPIMAYFTLRSMPKHCLSITNVFSRG